MTTGKTAAPTSKWSFAAASRSTNWPSHGLSSATSSSTPSSAASGASIFTCWCYRRSCTRRRYTRATAGGARAIGAVRRSPTPSRLSSSGYGLPDSVMRLAAAVHRRAMTQRLGAWVDLLLGADGVFRACEINADCRAVSNEATGPARLAQTAGFWQGLKPDDGARGPDRPPWRLPDRPGPGRGTVALLYATAYAEDGLRPHRARLERRPRCPLHRCPIPLASPRRCGLRRRTAVAALYRFSSGIHMDGQTNLDGSVCRSATGGQLRTLSSFTTSMLSPSSPSAGLAAR